MNADGGFGSGTAVVRPHPCTFKTVSRAGKDVYLDAARLSTTRPGFHKLVFLRPMKQMSVTSMTSVKPCRITRQQPPHQGGQTRRTASQQDMGMIA